MQAIVGGVCSYCGVSKNSSFERLIYQKVAIKIRENQNMVICICQNCCKAMGVEPSNQLNLMALAPLILSRFWNVEFSQCRMLKVKEALKGLLAYQGVATKKNDLGRKGESRMNISDKVAMNNSE